MINYCKKCSGSGYITDPKAKWWQNILITKRIICTACDGIGIVTPQNYFKTINYGRLLRKDKDRIMNTINIKKHLALLGLKVRDKVTGFEGIAESISFDLYGCIQVDIRPPVDEKGLPREGRWHDILRLEIMDKTPVMDVPNFDFGIQAEGKQGAADKPLK